MDDSFALSDGTFELSSDSCTINVNVNSQDSQDEVKINISDPDELLYNSGWQAEDSFHINEADLIDMITDEPDAEPRKLILANEDDDDEDELRFNIPIVSLRSIKKPPKRPSPKIFEDLQGKFKVLERVGEGTFGTVYKAQSIKGKQQIVALKRIYGMCIPQRIYNEINYLKILGGKHNVSPILGGFRTIDQITLILPFMKHDKFKDYMTSMSVAEIRSYMRALLEALAHVHSHNILHRDIKPGNFLADIKNQKYMLIDFGLAQFQSELESPTAKKTTTKSIAAEVPAPSPMKRKRTKDAEPSSQSTDLMRELKKTKMAALQKKNQRSSSMFASPLKASDIRASMEIVKKREEEERAAIPDEKKPNMQAPRAGTRGFRAPEVLFRYPYQTMDILYIFYISCVFLNFLPIDVWAAGIIFLSILSTRYPFFKNQDDDLAALGELVTIFGSAEMQKAALLIGRKFSVSMDYPRVSLKQLCEKLSSVKRKLPDSAYNLLEKCLDLNPFTRITAKEALSHAFFKEE